MVNHGKSIRIYEREREYTKGHLSQGRVSNSRQILSTKPPPRRNFCQSACLIKNPRVMRRQLVAVHPKSTIGKGKDLSKNPIGQRKNEDPKPMVPEPLRQFFFTRSVAGERFVDVPPAPLHFAAHCGPTHAMPQLCSSCAGFETKGRCPGGASEVLLDQKLKAKSFGGHKGMFIERFGTRNSMV